MTGSAQLTLGARCPRCRRDIPDDGQVLALTESAIEHLKSRHLVIPDNVYAALGTVARAMRCRLGSCEPF